MNLKFEPLTATYTLGIAFFSLLVLGHIGGVRNEKFGIFHEVIDLSGNMGRSLLTGEKDFDLGEWEPINGEAEPRNLTPDEIQEYVDQALEQ